MKFNYKNPLTGKPSSVVLSDHWVTVYLAVMAESWDDYDLPIQKRQAILHMLGWCADKYFDPCTNDSCTNDAGQPGPFSVRPSDCTFTTYLENYMAHCIYNRAAHPYEIAHSKQKHFL